MRKTLMMSLALLLIMTISFRMQKDLPADPDASTAIEPKEYFLETKIYGIQQEGPLILVDRVNKAAYDNRIRERIEVSPQTEIIGKNGSSVLPKNCY